MTSSAHAPSVVFASGGFLLSCSCGWRQTIASLDPDFASAAARRHAQLYAARPAASETIAEDWGEL